MQRGLGWLSELGCETKIDGVTGTRAAVISWAWGQQRGNVAGACAKQKLSWVFSGRLCGFRFLSAQ